VSQISTLRISHVQPKRSASKIMSQQAGCCRHNPERTAKDTKPGLFKSTELEKRTIKHFRDPYKEKKAAAPQQDVEMLEVQPEETWNAADPYALIRIDQNANDDEVVCDICLDAEDYEGDELVICDLCLVGVHQSCYGGNLKD
jgi:hypothetical protein